MSENDTSPGDGFSPGRTPNRTMLAARQSGDQLSPEALRLMLAMYRLQMHLAKRQKRLKKRADRPAPAPRPIVRRVKQRHHEYPDHAAIVLSRRASTAPSHAAPDRFPPAARIVCQPAPPIIENVAALAEAPPPLPMDDIDRAYGDDCAAIMQEFAHRMATARSGGEKRAIKTARKSALAAAKNKAKQAKAARQAANAQQRQGRAPPQSRPRPEPQPG
jgi:hypothetical protein